MNKPTNPGVVVRLKRYAWRLTAVYFWLKLVALPLVSDTHPLSRAAFQAIERLRGSLDLTPPDFNLFSSLLKAGWVLVITEFSFMQIMGLAVYCVTLFLWVPIRLFLGETLPPFRSGATLSCGLRPHPRSVPLFPAIGFLLISWTLLYGGTTSTAALLGGTIIAGLGFLVLTYKIIRSARPMDESDAAVLLKIRTGVAQYMKSGIEEDQKFASVKPTRVEAALHSKFNRIPFWMALKTALFLRGRKGKQRVGVIVFMESVTSLLLLGLTGAAFWSLLWRCYQPDMAWRTTFAVVVAKFLPGLGAPSMPGVLPLTLWVGPSLTAWFIFAVYLGIAASLFPKRQEVYATSATKAYDDLRTVVLYLKRKIERLRAMAAIAQPSASVAVTSPVLATNGVQCAFCGALLPPATGQRVKCTNCGTIN